MQIVKKINNNVALAVDDSQREVVVFGKGIGFRTMPYEYMGDPVIERSFYGVSASVANAISSIAPENLLVAADIADYAGVELDRKLNPNLPFTLADHIEFAIQRVSDGIDLHSPLESEARRVYPKECEIGEKAIGMIYGRTGVQLSEGEGINIALHIVNAEGAPGIGAQRADLHSVMESTEVLQQITELLENEFGRKIDTSSYEFMRFAAHVRFLVSRLSDGEAVSSSNRSLFRQAAEDFPETYRCAADVDEYLRTTKGWKCTDEELLYLMMHINRLQASVGLA